MKQTVFIKVIFLCVFLGNTFIIGDWFSEDNELTTESIENYKHPYIFISLGCDCKVATYIRSTDLNTYAYPLDWLLSFSCDAICDLLEDNFQKFLLPENLKDLKNYCKTTDYYHQGLGNLIILDHIHNIEYRHDFLADATVESQFEKIYKKYQRRIKRLYRALNQKERKVYLVRKQITKQEAQRLSTIINLKFPDLDYTLIALDNTQQIQIDWGIPHVKNFYFDNPSFYFDSQNKKIVHTPVIRTDLWKLVVGKLDLQ